MPKETDPLKILYPHVPPYKQVGEYLKSIQSTNQISLPRCAYNKARTGPDADLIAAQKAFRKVVEDLKAKRIFHAQKKIFLKDQWAELEKLEQKLNDQFQELNIFVLGNDDKRNRAKKRHAEDVKIIQKREEEIANRKKQLEIVEEVKKEIDTEIKSHKIYENYLGSVLGVTIEFKNADDILLRYESLIKTKTDLGERQRINFEELEEFRSKLNRNADECNFKILGMKNYITALQSRYLTASNTAMHWERIVHGIKSWSNQRYKEITEVKQGCRNTYLLMVKRKGDASKIPDDDFEKQILYIKKTLKELATVTAEANKLNKKTFSSMKATTSKPSTLN